MDKYNFKDIENLIVQNESSCLEFKKSTAELDAMGKALCGFLNHQGGIGVIGITDHKKIIGVDVTTALMTMNMPDVPFPEDFDEKVKATARQ